jgi:hypothetical protein
MRETVQIALLVRAVVTFGTNLSGVVPAPAQAGPGVTIPAQGGPGI